MAQVMLPASPALELGATRTLAAPVEVRGNGSNVYRAPANYQNTDLTAGSGVPPASLGQFWTQPK